VHARHVVATFTNPQQTNSVAFSARKRNIPSDRHLSAKFNANFCGQKDVAWSARRIPHGRQSQFSRLENVVSSRIEPENSGSLNRNTCSRKKWTSATLSALSQNGVSLLLYARTRGCMKLFEEDFEGGCLWHDGCVWGLSTPAIN
jgi:hypothetical protein